MARIQHELFPGIEDGAVGHLRPVIEQCFGVRDLPQGYFYLPIGSGGLELLNPMIEAFAFEKKSPSTNTKPGFEGMKDVDVTKYKSWKEE